MPPTEEPELLRARAAALEQLLDAHESAALEQARKLESVLAELRGSEASAAAVVRTALDCIVSIDEDGSVCEFNPAAERTFGYSRDEAMGRPLADLVIPPHLREAHRQAIARYRATGEGPILNQRIEITGMRKDGTEFPVELSVTPVEAGGRVFFTGYLRDISEQRRTLERLQQLQALTDVALEHLSLDDLLPELLQRLRDILVVDTAAIMLMTDDEHLVMRAAIGMDEGSAFGFRLPMGYGIAGRIAQGRAPVVVDDVEATDVVSPIIRGAGIRSVLGVPLVVETRVIGVLYVGSLTRRRFTAEETGLLELAAARMAIAIDHAGLYERQRNIAQVLQLSLLPEEVPAIEGLSFAVRYVPAGDGAQVGGDWYEVMRLHSGEVGLVIGDVAGRGIRAAATMGQLRYALRAYAMEGAPPKTVVERLDRLLQASDETQMATLLYGIFDPDVGSFRYTAAGHPPPLVIAPGGDVRYVEGGRSVPLGVVPGAVYQEDEMSLERGSVLLLYTDGLVEERGVDLDAGFARLVKAVSRAPEDVDGLCEQVLQRVFGGTAPKDDVAFLAMRYAATSPARVRLELPAIPESLRTLRRSLERWLRELGTRDEEAFEILVSCNEAAANTIEHAYGPGDATFEVDGSFSDSEVTVVVRDFGRWRLPRVSDRGRGLALIRMLMDHIEVTPTGKGTVVRMTRRLGRKPKA